jgi:hypothetical protein
MTERERHGVYEFTCGEVAASPAVIPGRIEDASPESRDSGSMLRIAPE